MSEQTILQRMENAGKIIEQSETDFVRKSVESGAGLGNSREVAEGFSQTLYAMAAYSSLWGTDKNTTRSEIEERTTQGIELVARLWQDLVEHGEVNHWCGFKLTEQLFKLCAQEMQKANPELSPPAPEPPQLGDYVIAYKWADRHPNDPWAIGFVRDIADWGGYQVGDMRGELMPAVGARYFKYAIKITLEFGRDYMEAHGDSGLVANPGGE